MTADEIRKYYGAALRLARDKANLSYFEAAHKACISQQSLENHEGGALPTLDNFLNQLKAYGLDFMSFHELLLEVKIRKQVGWKEEPRNISGKIIPARKA